MEIMSENYVKKLIKKGKRIDGRELLQFRKIFLLPSEMKKAEGGCIGRIGDTVVAVGIKLEVVQPYPDSPDEGVLIVNAEFPPIANPEFEPGPPGENAIELARLVDRLIRESNAIDMKKLVIEEGEKVWGVFVDIHVINDDGNLLDISALSSIRALLNTKIPKYEDGEVIREENVGNLPVHHKPVYVTLGFIDDKIIIDPNHIEEKILNCKLAIGTREDEMICAIQKMGSGTIKLQKLEEYFNIAFEKAKELRNLL